MREDFVVELRLVLLWLNQMSMKICFVMTQLFFDDSVIYGYKSTMFETPRSQYRQLAISSDSDFRDVALHRADTCGDRLR